MFLFRLLFEHRKTTWMLFISGFLLLLYGIFMPKVNAGVSFPHVDKLAHFSGFFAVFLFGRFATRDWLKGTYWIVPFVFAVLLEYLQGQWVTTRDFSYLDMLANTLGTCLALMVWLGVLAANKAYLTNTPQ